MIKISMFMDISKIQFYGNIDDIIDIDENSYKS